MPSGRPSERETQKHIDDAKKNEEEQGYFPAYVDLNEMNVWI